MNKHKSTLLDTMHFTSYLMQLADWDEIRAKVGDDAMAQLYILVRTATEDMERTNPGIAERCGYQAVTKIAGGKPL